MPYTRPTTDLAKEGLFNIIQNNLDIGSLTVHDLYGGTRSISYELASRGAADITVVEKDTQMYEFIKSTSASLGFTNFKVIKADVFKFIHSAATAYDLIFAGPPYALSNIDELPGKIFAQRLLKPGGWFILEHTPRNDYKKFDHYKTERNYGTTIFSIFIM